MPLSNSAPKAESLNEYIVVKEGNRFTARDYKPGELNKVIYDICCQHGQFTEPLFEQRKDARGYHLPSVKLNILQQAARKIVVFSTVNDSGKNCSYHGLDSLGNALQYYTKVKQVNKIDLSQAILIIPVAEAIRNHFRLLVITEHGINYYDSKNLLVTSGVGASISAAITTCLVADDALAAVSECSNLESEEESSTAAKALTFLGTFAQKAPVYYDQYRYPVLRICKNYFPDLSARDVSLGDQASFNFTNCGPLVAAYVKLIVMGQPVVLKEAIEDIRLSQRWGSDEEMFEALTERATLSEAELKVNETLGF